MMVSLFQKCLAFLSCLVALSLTGCLTGVGADADGSLFSKRFRYYYVETCRYDGIGPYDCGLLESVNPAYRVSLRIDSDGMATLNLDGDYYYYLEQEYSLDYDHGYGSFYRFYEDDGKLDVYKSGEILAFWGRDGYVTFYYFDFPY